MTDAHGPVRRLRAEDASGFRAIRLEALTLEPEAFETTLEKQSADGLQQFAEMLEKSTVFGAFHEGAVVGMAGFYVQEGAKVTHKGMLWGMYVSPRARGIGLGRALLRAVLAHARAHVEQVLLTVVADKEAARRLYESEGFVAYGLEKRALRHGSRYLDEILMVRSLD